MVYAEQAPPVCIISLQRSSLRSWLLKTWVISFLGQAIYVQRLTLTLRAAELLANHAAARAISSAQLHTGPGSGWAADRAALAASAATSEGADITLEPLRVLDTLVCVCVGGGTDRCDVLWLSFMSRCIDLNDERNTEKSKLRIQLCIFHPVIPD